MDSLRHFRHLVLVLVAGLGLGCDDKGGVEPPPPPPQISLQTIRGMPNEDVFDVFVDSTGRLWVSTDAGVLMFEGTQGPFDVSKGRLFTDRDGIPNLRCRGVTELNGKIFVATWGGGVGVGDSGAINDPGGQWKQGRARDGLANDRVFELAPDDDGSLWIATVTGVSHYIDDEDLPLEARFDTASSDRFGPGVFTSILVHDNPTRGHEVWASERSRDSVGVSIPGGIKVLRDPDFQYFSTETSGIPSDDVSEIVYDHARGIFWSAHPSNGVGSLDVDPRVWRNLTRNDGLVSNLAISVAINHLGTKWDAGTVWVATQDGLTMIAPDGKKMVNYTEGSGLPTLRVRTVYVDPNDDVWLGFVENGAAKVVP